jgi:hypothetical protein
MPASPGQAINRDLFQFWNPLNIFVRKALQWTDIDVKNGG